MSCRNDSNQKTPGDSDFPKCAILPFDLLPETFYFVRSHVNVQNIIDQKPLNFGRLYLNPDPDVVMSTSSLTHNNL